MARAIEIRQLGGGVAEALGPVPAGPPGGGFEDEPDPEPPRDPGVGAKVLLERRLAVGPAQQRVGGEVGQLEPVLEDQGGLDAAVGEEQVPAELRARRYGTEPCPPSLKTASRCLARYAPRRGRITRSKASTSASGIS